MHDYPYLGASLLLMAFALTTILVWRRHSPMLWVAGVLCLPFGLFSFAFIPQYWDPRVVAWLGFVSLEDLLFSSSTGVIALAVGLGAWRWRIESTLRIERIAPRYLAILALGVGLGHVLWYTLPDPEIMTNTMAGLTASFAYMLANRRDAWPVVVAGGVGFGALHLLVIKASVLIWPHFFHHWQPDVPLGFWWGVPVCEMVWSVGFGACWPLYMVFALDIRRAPVATPLVHAATRPVHALPES